MYNEPESTNKTLDTDHVFGSGSHDTEGRKTDTKGTEVKQAKLT